MSAAQMKPDQSQKHMLVGFMLARARHNWRVHLPIKGGAIKLLKQLERLGLRDDQQPAPVLTNLVAGTSPWRTPC